MKSKFEIRNRVLIAYKGNKTVVRVPRGVKVIGQNAFRGCDTVTSIRLPRSVTTICECAFFGCSSLREITLSAKLSVIRKDAFAHCKMLETITFPKRLSSLSSAFDGCESLSLLVFKGKRSIYLGKGVFSGAPSSLGVHFGGSLSLWESMTASRNAVGEHLSMGEFERGREFPLYHAIYGEGFRLTVYCGKSENPLIQSGTANDFAEWRPYF